MLNINENTLFSDIWEAEEFRSLRDTFIAYMDIENAPCFHMTLDEMDRNGFSKKSLIRGFLRLQKNLEAGRRMMSFVPEEEAAADPRYEKTGLLFFPSDDPKASERPFVMVVPGGGYVNVWNMTEGYPIAAHFNELGYHAFILSYRVTGTGVMPAPLEDLAAAMRLIKARAAEFNVDPESYLITGFSAGGNLVSAWCTENHGYPVFGLPKPKAVFPVYPCISWREFLKSRKDRDDEFKNSFSMITLGLSLEAAAETDWNIEDHVSAFPPAYIVLAADDDLVPKSQSVALKDALDRTGIFAVLEMGEHGGHGFGEGWKADTCGWIERAAAFSEKL